MAAHKLFLPQNAKTAELIKFVPKFRQLYLGWTAFAPISKGVEQFVEEYLPVIR